MPTAPRRPTHDMNSFSRHEKRNGARQMNTASGRATSISVERDRERRRARARGSRSGQASRPSSTNMTICASQVAASRKTTTVLWARVGRLPTTRPAT